MQLDSRLKPNYTFLLSPHVVKVRIGAAHFAKRTKPLPLQQAKVPTTKPNHSSYDKQKPHNKAKPLPYKEPSLMLKKHSEKQANPAKYPQHSTL